MRNKLVTFRKENIVINNFQYGFRNKRPSLTNLLGFHSYVFNMYDETKAVDIIYLDFQTAVPPKRLLNKFEYRGIAGKIFKLVED